MNAYSIGISSSWWFPILLVIAGVAIAVFTYKETIPPISGRRKAILITLRSIAIALLLFVLFEPVLTIIRGSHEQPRLAVLLDNSLSVAQTDPQGDRKAAFLKAIDNSNFISLKSDQLKMSEFDAEVKQIKPEDLKSINHAGQMTDISKAIRWAGKNAQEENTRAILLISDGQFNTGNNPIYDAEEFGKPVFVIGIGDTAEPRDVSVQSVVTNEFAYVDNPIPVNINTKITGYQSGEVKLTLYDNGSAIGTQTINVHPDMQVYSSIFEYNPKVEGIHKLTATATTLDKEVTGKNNSLSEFVHVLKNKRRVSIFAGSPSPDVSFVKNAFSQEKGVEIKEYIQKSGAEFYTNPDKSAIQATEIFVLVGFPISSTPASVIDNIKQELSRGKPLFFIASEYTDYNKLKALEDYLPFTTISSRPQEFLALPDFRQQSLSNPLLKVNGTEKDLDYWNQLPPVFRTETFVKVKPEADILSTIKVNNVPMKEPLIMTRSFQNTKTVAFLGYGLFRWKLLGYAAEVAKGRKDTPDLFDVFFRNAFRWLSINQENKNIIIKTTKRLYTNNEKVEFIAQVYDAALSPIDNATVNVKVGGGSQTRELILNSLGNGRYQGLVEGLPEGDYAFNGSVTVNNNRLGADNGRFSVGDIALEYQNLNQNSALLRDLANRTGGKYYTVDEAKNFMKDLQENKSFTPRGITNRSEFALWSQPWILAISILCFGLEWFLRKRAGMV